MIYILYPVSYILCPISCVLYPDRKGLANTGWGWQTERSSIYSFDGGLLVAVLSVVYRFSSVPFYINNRRMDFIPSILTATSLAVFCLSFSKWNVYFLIQQSRNKDKREEEEDGEGGKYQRSLEWKSSMYWEEMPPLCPITQFLFNKWLWLRLLIRKANGRQNAEWGAFASSQIWRRSKKVNKSHISLLGSKSSVSVFCFTWSKSPDGMQIFPQPLWFVPLAAVGGHNACKVLVLVSLSFGYFTVADVL